MPKKIVAEFKDLLAKLHLRPISVAAKCRVQFGGAVVLIIFLALLIPYYWMGLLTKKSSLDTGRTVFYLVRNNNFVLDESAGRGATRVKLSTDQADIPVRWIPFSKDDPNMLDDLNSEQKDIVKRLIDEEDIDDHAWISGGGGMSYNNYIALVRSKDISLTGQAIEADPSLNPNEPVGILVSRTPALQVSRTKLLNNLAIIIAGALAGVGALIAFYIIAQRIILRPIRQLRALVNNIAEGNLSARSAIKTQDEYQRLSDAFNAMLDGLQESQDKLRKANLQLDAKIAELSDRNIELYKANKIKSEFLANMSHEFRTPLNAILGFAEILKDKGQTEKNVRYAENIITSGRNLLGMINDLLDLAKAEAGKIQVRPEETSLPILCKGIVGMFGPLLENKKLHMKLDLDEDMPMIVTDPNKVQQILFNFVSNAIKFTPDKGTIHITAGITDEQTARISVSDTGPGIAEKDHEKIFEKFRQADSSITKESTGTGLGLAISKELSALLAGSVGVQSDQGKGATFWLELPISIAPEQQKENETQQ